MNKTCSSRRSATFALVRWLSTHEFPADLLPDGPERSFVQDVVYTTIRRLRPLRLVLGELVRRWPKGELEALLYVGAAQILYMDDVPDFAAVNETVAAAKQSPNPNVARVVNGVLRNLIRRRDDLMAMVSSAAVEVRESFPTELVRRWTARFGAESAAKLCALYNEPAETFLARPDGSFTVLERGCRVADVAGYGAGEFIVQDPGTALAVGLVDAHPGETVLDACAAPGGKAVQLAWRGAELTACEVNPRRRRRLEENLVRVRLRERIAVVQSLEEAGSRGLGVFAKVLVDAPCSNTGVLRRRPDARWNWSAEKLSSLVALQAQILDRVAPLVADGGTLVYSTCSIETEENDKQVSAFVARHPEFSVAEIASSLPHVTGHDGAFAAKLVKMVARKGIEPLTLGL